MTGPTPVIFSNSCLSAVLMLILVDCSGVELGERVGSGVGVGRGVADDEGVGVGVKVGIEVVVGLGVVPISPKSF